MAGAVPYWPERLTSVGPVARLSIQEYRRTHSTGSEDPSLSGFTVSWNCRVGKLFAQTLRRVQSPALSLQAPGHETGWGLSEVPGVAGFLMAWCCHMALALVRWVSLLVSRSKKSFLVSLPW